MTRSLPVPSVPPEGPPTTVAELRARIRAERRRAAEAVRAFTTAVAADDRKALVEALTEVEACCVWRRAIVAAARVRPVPPGMRDAFLALWGSCGDGLRCEVGDDLALCDALRALLPPCAGGPMVLDRGDGARNRRCRTYGPSRTASREVAGVMVDPSRARPRSPRRGPRRRW